MIKTMRALVLVEFRADEEDDDSIQEALVDKLDEMVQEYKEEGTLIDYSVEDVEDNEF
jgi:hypothetical protein